MKKTETKPTLSAISERNQKAINSFYDYEKPERIIEDIEKLFTGFVTSKCADEYHPLELLDIRVLCSGLDELIATAKEVKSTPVNKEVAQKNERAINMFLQLQGDSKHDFCSRLQTVFIGFLESPTAQEMEPRDLSSIAFFYFRLTEFVSILKPTKK